MVVKGSTTWMSWPLKQDSCSHEECFYDCGASKRYAIDDDTNLLFILGKTRMECRQNRPERREYNRIHLWIVDPIVQTITFIKLTPRPTAPTPEVFEAFLKTAALCYGDGHLWLVGSHVPFMRPDQARTMIFTIHIRKDQNLAEYDEVQCNTLVMQPRFHPSVTYSCLLRGVVVFGGQRNRDQCYDDLWLVHHHGMECISGEGEAGAPCPRHSATVNWIDCDDNIEKGKLVLFGGVDRNGNVLNDVYMKTIHVKFAVDATESWSSYRLQNWKPKMTDVAQGAYLPGLGIIVYHSDHHTGSPNRLLVPDASDQGQAPFRVDVSNGLLGSLKPHIVNLPDEWPEGPLLRFGTSIWGILDLARGLVWLAEPSATMSEVEPLMPKDVVMSSPRMYTILVGEEETTFTVDGHTFTGLSHLFEAAFKAPMNESRNHRIYLPTVSPESFKSILYLLDEQSKVSSDDEASEQLAKDLCLDEETIVGVLKAADYLMADRLRRACERWLLPQVNCDNVLQLLVIADTYNVCDLRQHCVKVIVKCFKEIRDQPPFQNLLVQRGELAIEILKALPC
eukprot:Clim_evm11s168 gene=Clim_evmTU11s168